MIRVYYVAALVVILAACQPKENAVQLKAINESLEKSNAVIGDACRRSLDEMEVKRREMPADEEILKWLSIMNKIKTETDDLANIIDNVKEQVLTLSDDFIIEGTPILKTLPQPNGPGYNLLKKLASFKDSIPVFFIVTDTVDNPSYYAYLKKDLMSYRNNGPLLPGYAENLNDVQRTAYINKWLHNNLHGTSPLMTMIVLNKLKNDVLYTRTALMDFCNSKVGIVDGPGSYEHFSIIAVVNSNYVKRGQTIELTAGAAEFSTARKPRVIINDKEVKLDDQGVALYKFKATGTPGKHIIPVNIELTMRNGAREIITKKVEYTIANEK